MLKIRSIREIFLIETKYGTRILCEVVTDEKSISDNFGGIPLL